MVHYTEDKGNTNSCALQFHSWLVTCMEINVYSYFTNGRKHETTSQEKKKNQRAQNHTMLELNFFLFLKLIFFDYTMLTPHTRYIVGKTRPNLTQFFETKRLVRRKKKHD